MVQIELIEWNRAGEKVKIDYFIGDKEESLTMAYDNLIEHVSEEGLNQGWAWGGRDEDGSREQEDVCVDSAEWTSENERLAIESYLEKLHKIN